MTISFSNRRLRTRPVLALVLLSLLFTQCTSETSAPTFVQAPLPYAENALEPYMSAKTLSYHYGKHHAAYVKNANKLLAETSLTGDTVEDIIRESAENETHQALFNQAAQAWNHSFFWNCLTPSGGGEPSGKLLNEIKLTYGSFEKFKAAFLGASKSVFGSGWVWLVKDDGKLSIITTADADTPIAHDLIPLFGVDVWEHAYYLDYQNKRQDYVSNILTHLANWDFASTRYETSNDD
jgi:superoxide dismutase, Fe-Mn family